MIRPAAEAAGHYIEKYATMKENSRRGHTIADNQNIGGKRMKSIFSTILTAALLLSALTACGRSNAGGRVEEARATPKTNVTGTSRPAATSTPAAAADNDRGSVGNAIGDAAEKAGDAVGDVVGGVGNAVGDAVGGVGNAIGGAAGAVGNETDDNVDDTVDDTRGVNSTARPGTNRKNP